MITAVFRRSKVYYYFQSPETLLATSMIRRLKVEKNVFLNFQPPEKIVSHKFNQEIESFKSII
jgi:hypothetical protein